MERNQGISSPDDDTLTTLDGCILLTEEQIDAMMLQLNETTDSDFQRSMVPLWPAGMWYWTPLAYKFDGSHSEYGQGRPSPKDQDA